MLNLPLEKIAKEIHAGATSVPVIASKLKVSTTAVYVRLNGEDELNEIMAENKEKARIQDLSNRVRIANNLIMEGYSDHYAAKEARMCVMTYRKYKHLAHEAPKRMDADAIFYRYRQILSKPLTGQSCANVG